MNIDQCIELIKYVDKRFGEVNDRIEKLEVRTDGRFDQLTSIIDGYAGKLEAYTMEMAAMQHKIDRLENTLKCSPIKPVSISTPYMCDNHLSYFIFHISNLSCYNRL